MPTETTFSHNTIELDAVYMRRAIALARNGAGYVNPNPRVGAVIVKDGRIIGEGWHARYGEPHAERNALQACTEDPAGATIYVTLEPCCHTGKQPPCTEALLEAQIGRVVIGSRDPNPLVSGKGARILREAGIPVTEDFLRAECDQLNPSFFHYISTGMPYVTLKYAMTLDGKIACATGKSKWVTGPEARADVHRLRGLHTAIMVGSGTVLADDPLLTVRSAEGLDPVRIVCDTRLRTPAAAALLTDIKGADPAESRFPRTILATGVTEEDRLRPYREAGAEILQPGLGPDGHLDMPALLRELGARKVDSILVEGGAELAWSLLRAGLVNKVCAYVAPKLFGGADAKTPVGGTGFPAPDEAVRLTDIEIRHLGADLAIEGSVEPCLPES